MSDRNPNPYVKGTGAADGFDRARREARAEIDHLTMERDSARYTAEIVKKRADAAIARRDAEILRLKGSVGDDFEGGRAMYEYSHQFLIENGDSPPWSEIGSWQKFWRDQYRRAHAAAHRPAPPGLPPPGTRVTTSLGAGVVDRYRVKVHLDHGAMLTVESDDLEVRESP